MGDEFVLNKSKSYLLPLFNEYVKIKHINQIINTYIYIENYDKLCFAILYKFNSDFNLKDEEEDGYIFYEKELINSSFFIKKIDINDYTLFVFDVPKNLVYEFSCFLEGKYSWFRKHNKLIIINFLNNNFKQVPQVVNTIIQVLNKSDSLKLNLEKQLNIIIPDDVELSSKVILEEETFRMSKF